MKSQKVALSYYFLSVFFVLLLALFLASSNLRAQDLKTRSISTAEYCDFLNQTAAENSYHRYDDIMASDIKVASIVQLGRPGCYHYEVIAGRENFPVSYVGKADRFAFCQAEELLDNDQGVIEDPFLKSNQRKFDVVLTSSQNAQLCLSTSLLQDSTYMDDLQWIGVVSAVVLGGFLSKCCNADAESLHGAIEDLNGPLLNEEESLSYASTDGQQTQQTAVDMPVEVPTVVSSDFYQEKQGVYSLTKRHLPGIVEGDESAPSPKPLKKNLAAAPLIEPGQLDALIPKEEAPSADGQQSQNIMNLGDVGSIHNVYKKNKENSARRLSGSVQSGGSGSTRASTRVKKRADGLTRSERAELKNQSHQDQKKEG